MSTPQEPSVAELRAMIDAVNDAANFEANHSCFDPRLNAVLAFLDAEAARRELPKESEAELRAAIARVRTELKGWATSLVWADDLRRIVEAAERSLEKP